MNPEQLDQTRLRNMAVSLAKRLGRHECPAQLAQDLMQAAWVKFLKLTNYTHLWGDMYYAMLEELSQWNWECKRGRGKGVELKEKLPISAWRGTNILFTLTPEQVLIWKESIQKERTRTWRREYMREYTHGARRRKPEQLMPEELKQLRKTDPKAYYTEYRRRNREKLRLANVRSRRNIKYGGGRTVSLLEKYGVEVVRRALKRV